MGRADLVRHNKMECPMSALGQKRTLNRLHLMSALPPKADIAGAMRNVRFVPEADIGAAARHAHSDIGPKGLRAGTRHEATNSGVAAAVDIGPHNGRAKTVGLGYHGRVRPRGPSDHWREQSTYKCDPLLGICLNSSPRLRRQLKNCSLLAFSHTCQEHDLAVRKFQRIVMSDDPVFIDLPKDRRLVLDHPIPPTQHADRLARNLASKG